MSIDEDRAAEARKYADILIRWPKYGDANHGRAAARFILDDIKPTSIVDVGCGGNHFAKSMKQLGIPAIGVDIVNPAGDVIAPAHSIPFGEGEFDLLTSFDVLEHLLPAEINDVLTEWRRVSARFVVSAAFFSHMRDGVELHMTQRPAHWWLDTLGRFGDVDTAPVPCDWHLRRYFYGVWR